MSLEAIVNKVENPEYFRGPNASAGTDGPGDAGALTAGSRPHALQWAPAMSHGETAVSSRIVALAEPLFAGPLVHGLRETAAPSRLRQLSIGSRHAR